MILTTEFLTAHLSLVSDNPKCEIEINGTTTQIKIGQVLRTEDPCFSYICTSDENDNAQTEEIREECRRKCRKVNIICFNKSSHIYNKKYLKSFFSGIRIAESTRKVLRTMCKNEMPLSRQDV